MKRKIAAILAADIVGYSRLVREDEEETLRRLDTCRAVFGDCILRFGGRVVDMAGDSILAEFQTAIDAVRCAADAQESLRSSNLDCSPSRKMEYRIGVTVGDVLERDGFLLGEGVNIASRLQAVAPAGGICISRSVYEAVAHKLSLKFVDVGQQQLKNIPLTVHAYTTELDQAKTRSRPKIISFSWPALAVLMVVGLGAAAAYFLSGAKQETGLVANEHTTTDGKKCATPDTDKNEAIAACTRLLERGEGAFLDQGDYERTLKDLNEALRLSPDAALADYSRGVAYFYKRDFGHAVTDLKRALELDSRDAKSESYLGRALQGLGHFDEAVSHLTKAIGLNARNEDFYRFRGDVLLDKGTYPSAISDYDEAIRLNPSSGPAFRSRGIVHLKQGHAEEAISDLTKAIDLSREDWYARHLRGRAYGMAGDYAKAADDETEALRLKPDSAQILSGRADALLKENKVEAAMRDVERALSIDPGFAAALATRGQIHEALDQRTEAVADFERALATDGTNEEAKKGLTRLNAANLSAPW